MKLLLVGLLALIPPQHKVSQERVEQDEVAQDKVKQDKVAQNTVQHGKTESVRAADRQGQRWMVFDDALDEGLVDLLRRLKPAATLALYPRGELDYLLNEHLAPADGQGDGVAAERPGDALDIPRE